MQIVIDIPNEVWTIIERSGNVEWCGIEMADAIKNATPLNDCTDAISREEVKELLDEYYAELTLDETALKSNAIAIKVTRHIINDIEALPSINPIKPKTDVIPVEWLKEKLVNHPELSYSLTDGIKIVLDFWEAEMENE